MRPVPDILRVPASAQRVSSLQIQPSAQVSLFVQKPASMRLRAFTQVPLQMSLGKNFSLVVAEQSHVDCVNENLRKKDVFELSYTENLSKGTRLPKQIVQDSFEKSQIALALLYKKKCFAVGGISARQSLLPHYRMPWMVGTDVLTNSPKPFVFLKRLYQEICTDFTWLANITITSKNFGGRESLVWLEKIGFTVCSWHEWKNTFGLPVYQKSAKGAYNAKWNDVWVFYSKRR